jgi:isocitrate dehydrogenase
MSELDKGSKIRRKAGRASSTGRPDSGAGGSQGARGRTRSAPTEDDAAQRTQAEALYDRFAERSRELFETSQEKGRDAFEKAMEVARAQLAAAGEFTAEQGEAFKKYLERDLEQTAEDFRALGQEAEERLHPSRVGAGALSSLARLLHATGRTMVSLSQRAEETLAYQTGEITTAGTLTCSACGQTVQLKATGHVPPCPSCHGTRFRKSY